MHFTLTIDLSDKRFSDPAELRQVLRRTAEQVWYTPDESEAGRIETWDGERIGRWQVTQSI